MKNKTVILVRNASPNDFTSIKEQVELAIEKGDNPLLIYLPHQDIEWEILELPDTDQVTTTVINNSYWNKSIDEQEDRIVENE